MWREQYGGQFQDRTPELLERHLSQPEILDHNKKVAAWKRSVEESAFFDPPHDAALHHKQEHQMPLVGDQFHAQQ